MIQIVCIVTGTYEEYFKGFIESLENFFPLNRKFLTILTDNLDLPKNYKCGKNIDIETFYLPNLLYPTINLNKPVLLNDQLFTKLDYYFIIDVDTIFMQKDYDFWQSLMKRMNDGEILLTKHPFYSMADNARLWGLMKKDLISNLYTDNLTEKDNRFSSYIPDGEYTYVNSSFWGGKRDAVKEFNDKIIELAKCDLTRYPNGWHIPKYMDENYINKMYWDFSNGESDLKLHADTYSVLGNVQSNVTDTVFMYQKNLASGTKAY